MTDQGWKRTHQTLCDHSVL